MSQPEVSDINEPKNTNVNNPFGVGSYDAELPIFLFLQSIMQFKMTYVTIIQDWLRISESHIKMEEEVI